MAAADKRLSFGEAAFWVFALTIALAPVGFGGNRPLPFGLIQIGLAVASFLLLCSPGMLELPRFFTRIRVALGLLGAVLVWAWVQTLPIVPASWVNPLWQEAGATLGVALHGTIAISPEDSRAGLTRLMTYIAAGILGYVVMQSPGRARRFLLVIWAAGAAISVYGLIVHIFGIEKILWFPKTAYEGDLTATFVNRNHFAVYAALSMLCGLTLLIQSWREDVQKAAAQPVMQLVQKWMMRKGLPQLLLMGLVFAAIAFSHSRAGLILAIGGFGACIFFYLVYRKAWKLAVLVALAGVSAVALTFIIAPHYSERFATLFTDYSSQDRVKVWTWTLQAIRDNPWLGYGLDGFQPVFRLYQHGMTMEFVRAHSDALESLLDLGVPFGLLLWLAIALLLSGLLHGLRTRRRQGSFPALALAASLVALAHACVDFDLQIPGVALTWVALLGTGLAQSWRQAEKSGAPVPVSASGRGPGQFAEGRPPTKPRPTGRYI